MAAQKISRFGQEWEEHWKFQNGRLCPYPDEYYRLQRKEIYEQDRKIDKYTVESWESDGYGYAVFHNPKSDKYEWLLTRTDLVDYYSVCHQFYTKEQMEERISKERWRPYEQLTLF